MKLSFAYIINANGSSEEMQSLLSVQGHRMKLNDYYDTDATNTPMTHILETLIFIAQSVKDGLVLDQFKIRSSFLQK